MPLQLMSPDVQLNKLNSMRVESDAFANEEPSLLSMNFESIERTLDKRRESESFVDFYQRFDQDRIASQQQFTFTGSAQTISFPQQTVASMMLSNHELRLTNSKKLFSQDERE